MTARLQDPSRTSWRTARKASVLRRRSRRMPRLEKLENRVLLAVDAYEPNDDFESAWDLGQGDQTLYNLSIHALGDDD